MRTFLKRLFRRLFPQQQTSMCPNGHTVTERRRKPCPECGEFSRTVVSTATDSMGAKDRA